MIAAVHLFTLGWIMLSIFGALCQFLPVAIGKALRWQSLAHVTFGLQVLGAAGFVTGQIEGQRDLVIAGAAALSGAFGLFALNLGVTLASVRERSLTWWALAGATLYLVVTPLYGVLLQLNLVDGLGVHRYHVVAVHAHVAIVGVVLLVIVGVAHRLIPMFLLSHGADERPAWIAVGLLATAAALLWLERLNRLEQSYADSGTRWRTLSQAPLRGLKGWAAFVYCSLLVLFGLIVPAGWLAWRGLSADPQLDHLLRSAFVSFGLACAG
ncbi:MAG TPA: hypothetical protein VFS15_29100, partial [Kofleriaceae bacterium]|nr:hypothetical protein [Kofleriaceae bacterium]